MVNFDGDPSGSPNKNGMSVISDRNYNVRARDPLGIPPFFSFNTATVWGHAYDDVHWYARKSRGILMISYLLWGCIFKDVNQKSEIIFLVLPPSIAQSSDNYLFS